MGLERRPTSGKINGGSNLIVPGLNVYSVKVIPNTFGFKKGSGVDNKRIYNVTTPTPSQTPLPTPTPTPTPTQNILDAIVVTNDTYIEVGQDLYLRYVE
jgi:hypothetical protein